MLSYDSQGMPPPPPFNIQQGLFFTLDKGRESDDSYISDLRTVVCRVEGESLAQGPVGSEEGVELASKRRLLGESSVGVLVSLEFSHAQ